jgi:hypothetical protein
MTSKARLSWICAVPLVALAAAACESATTPNDSSISSASTAMSAPPSGTTGPAVPKVSANMASESEIEAALRAAGVSNSGRWAKEVVEYRPYPADDPNLTKLRESLANPGQETVDKIVSALTP